MNTALVTGYLMQAAHQAFTPQGIRKLIFDAMLQADGDDQPTPWHCEIEDPMEISRAERLLTAGRGVVLRAQLAGRPYMKHGALAGFVKFLRVERVEFVRADRAGKQEEIPTEEAAAK